jgi:hypothetical protein
LEAGLSVVSIRRPEILGTRLSKPSLSNFIGEAVDNERRSVNGVSLARSVADKRATALTTDELSHLLTGIDFERTIKPIVCFPCIRLHFQLALSCNSGVAGRIAEGERRRYSVYIDVL